MRFTGSQAFRIGQVVAAIVIFSGQGSPKEFAGALLAGAFAAFTAWKFHED